MGGLSTGTAEEQLSSGGPGRSAEHGVCSATEGAVRWERGHPGQRGAVRWEQGRWGDGCNTGKAFQAVSVKEGAWSARRVCVCV